MLDMLLAELTGSPQQAFALSTLRACPAAWWVRRQYSLSDPCCHLAERPPVPSMVRRDTQYVGS